MSCCGKPDSLYRLHIDFMEIPSDTELYIKTKGSKEDVLFHNCSSEKQVALLITKASGAVTSMVVEPSTSKVSKIRCQHDIRTADSVTRARILKYTKFYE